MSHSAESQSVNDYILNAIRQRVWSGFYNETEIHELIDELLEGDADEDLLRAAVAPELDRKAEAEKSWPAVTECDRLDQVFEALDAQGILCLQNAGYTRSDGHEDAQERLSQVPAGRYWGYLFYHGQDLEGAVDGEGLWLAFDHVNGEPPEILKVGLAVNEALLKAGFSTQWNETHDRRIHVIPLDWKRRYQGPQPRGIHRVEPPDPKPKNWFLRWLFS